MQAGVRAHRGGKRQSGLDAGSIFDHPPHSALGQLGEQLTK